MSRKYGFDNRRTLTTIHVTPVSVATHYYNRFRRSDSLGSNQNNITVCGRAQGACQSRDSGPSGSSERASCGFEVRDWPRHVTGARCGGLPGGVEASRFSW